MPVIIFFVIAAVFHIALKRTRYGKYVYAIGGNMTSAKVSGINVNKYPGDRLHHRRGRSQGWRGWCWRRASAAASRVWGCPTSWTRLPPR